MRHPLPQYHWRTPDEKPFDYNDYIDVSVVATYIPKLTWRERLHVIWTDRIVGAWRVLIGKAWAEEYDARESR